MTRKLVKWMENENYVILVDKDKHAEWAEAKFKRPLDDLVPPEQTHDTFYFPEEK